MYIHFSIYRCSEILNWNFFVLIPEKILNNSEENTEQIKHKRKLFLTQEFQNNFLKTYFITQNKKIIEATNFLFFQFGYSNINLDAIKKNDSEEINLNLFFTIFPYLDIKKTFFEDVVFDFVGYSNFKIDVNKYKYKYKIKLKRNIINENIIEFIIFDRQVLLINNIKNEYLFKQEEYSLEEFNKQFSDLFNEIVKNNYILFL